MKFKSQQMKFKSQQSSNQHGANDEAYYPRLDQRPASNSREMGSLWMAGFLHHEEIENEKKVSDSCRNRML